MIETCTSGHYGSRTNACDRDALAGGSLCRHHQDVDDYLERLAASMPDDLDEEN